MKISSEERRKKLMTDPKVYAKVNQLAEIIVKQLSTQTNIMVDIKLGAVFSDIETGQKYTYDGLATPYVHSDIVSLVTDMAQKPLENLNDASYFIISEKFSSRHEIVMPYDSNTTSNMNLLQGSLPPFKGQNMLISGRDFIKYFALGKWKLDEEPIKPDADDFAQEKDILKKII